MNSIKLKIRKDMGYDEYCVMVYVNGIHNEMQSYYTDDKEDAIDTCNQMKLEYEKQGNTVKVASGIQYISGD